ncbi:MAG: hypothetical protein WBE89_16100 [Methyloceanibacter sp.]
MPDYDRRVVRGKYPRSVEDRHSQLQSLAIESGAFIDGRLVQVRGNGQMPVKLERKSEKKVAKRESLSRRIERAVEADKSEAGEPGRVFTEH